MYVVHCIRVCVMISCTKKIKFGCITISSALSTLTPCGKTLTILRHNTCDTLFSPYVAAWVEKCVIFALPTVQDCHYKSAIKIVIKFLINSYYFFISLSQFFFGYNTLTIRFWRAIHFFISLKLGNCVILVTYSRYLRFT